MTTEKARADFNELAARLGLEQTETTELNGKTLPVFTRRFSKTEEVAWYGLHETTLELKVYFFGSQYVAATFSINGRAPELREYTTPKRAANALEELLRCAGF